MPFKRRKNQNKKPESKSVQNPIGKLAPGHKKFGLGFDPDRVLELGDSLPAEWNFYPDGRMWIQQEHYFDAKIGITTVRFKTNDPPLTGFVPCRVQNCLFPDGHRGLALAGNDPSDHTNIVWRRPTTDRGLWWPGSVKLSPDDAIFSDADELLPIEIIDEDERKYWLAGALMGENLQEEKIFWTDFYNACARSDILKSKIRNDNYASEFWGLFLDSDFIQKATCKEVYYTSDRRIGYMLSKLRGCGEDYMDFYSGNSDGLGPQPTEKETGELLKIFAELGFVPKSR